MIIQGCSNEKMAYDPILVQNGLELFDAKCIACHAISERPKVGPGLANVTERKSDEWIAQFVRNSSELILSGDVDAVAIFNEYNQIPMPAYELSDNEMKSLLSYLRSIKGTSEFD